MDLQLLSGVRVLPASAPPAAAPSPHSPTVPPEYDAPGAAVTQHRAPHREMARQGSSAALCAILLLAISSR